MRITKTVAALAIIAAATALSACSGSGGSSPTPSGGTAMTANPARVGPQQ